MGAAILSGGLKFKVQKFNIQAARSQATMLALAVVALVVPAAFHYLSGPAGVVKEFNLSFDISIVLLITYALSLVFSLRTHKQLFSGQAAEAAQAEDDPKHSWSMGKSVAVLAGATALIAWVSEMLVASVDAAARDFGMSTIFVG